MKLRHFIALFSLIFVALIFSSCADKVTLPDYSKWRSESVIARSLHNGKEVDLLEIDHFDIVINRDLARIKRYVSIIHNEEQKPWLLFYMVVNESDKIDRFYIFENKNGPWSLVKDFTNTENIEKEVLDFVKAQYNLEPSK